MIVTGCDVDVGVTANWFELGAGMLEDEAELTLLPAEMFKAEVEVWFKMEVSRASSASDRTGQEKLRHKSGSNVSIVTHQQSTKVMVKFHLPGNSKLSQVNDLSPKGVAVSS